MTVASITHGAPPAQLPALPLIEQATRSLEHIASENGADMLDVIAAVSERGEPYDDWTRAIVAAADRLEAQIRLEERRPSAPAPHPSWSGGRVIVCRQCHKTDCGHMRRRRP